MQRRGIEPGEITGLGQIGGNFPRDIIRHALGRRDLTSPASLLRRALELFLKKNARKDAMLFLQMPQVLGLDRRDHARIRKWRVAPRKTHAIDHHLVVLGRRGHHPSARAHAKRMHAALADLCRETITRGGQQTRTLFRSTQMILDPVDERLRVLDAKSHREGLGLEQNFFLRQKPVHITRGMPRRKNHRIAGNFLSRCGHHAVNFFLLEQKIDDLRFKAHFTTRRNDRCPHRLDDIWQKVRSNVRMRVGEHALGGTVGDEDLVDLRHRTALGRASVQLAIRKCAGTTFAEAIV